MSEMPSRIYTLEDQNGNRMNIPEDITFEKAMEKITAGYDVTIHTYVLQSPRIVSRKEPTQ